MLKEAIKNNSFNDDNNIEYEDYSPEIKLNVSTIIPINYISKNIQYIKM